MTQSLVSEAGKAIPAVVHLDLDGGKHIARAHGWNYPAAEDSLFATGLRRALDFFDKASVRATLFVIAEDLDDPGKRSLLVEATRRGHEIASHTLTHRLLTSLPHDEKRREIFESRARLRQELGVEARGFRAPGYAMDRESLELIAEAGYAYDSSLFPHAESARRAGVDGLSAVPHRPLPGRELVELPMPAHRPLPWPFHPSYSIVLGEWYFRLGLRLFRDTGAPLVLLFHLTDFSDPLPGEYLQNRTARIYTLSHLSGETKLRRCEQMLALVQRRYRLMNTRQLLDQAASETLAAVWSTA